MRAIDPLAVDALNRRFAGAAPQDILGAVIGRGWWGGATLVSSFGAEAAVLLHMAAQIDRSVDVVFINTGKLFGETLRYRDRLIRRLGLTSVRTVTPNPALAATNDPKGVLWTVNPDRCCFVRKVEPLNRALKDVNVWISGRKGFHGGRRAALKVFELVDGRIKVNPLANWSRDDVQAYFAAHDLPRHPLEADGYFSIGCMPCTSPVGAGEDIRAGRWRGRDKSECGIHIGIAQGEAGRADGRP